VPQPNRNATTRLGDAETGGPTSKQEWALVSIRRLLLEGELKPGQRVNQGELAARIGVSPVPVREALHVLGSDGLLEFDPGRGFRVAAPSRDDVAEVDLLSRLLEGEALRRGIPVITDEEIARMRDLFEELLALHGSDDIVRKTLVHRELHFVPFRAARLRLLEGDLARYWAHTDHHRVLYMFKDKKRSRQALLQHKSVIDACETRDPDEVIRVMNIHRDFAMDHMLARASEAASSNTEEKV